MKKLRDVAARVPGVARTVGRAASVAFEALPGEAKTEVRNRVAHKAAGVAEKGALKATEVVAGRVIARASDRVSPDVVEGMVESVTDAVAKKARATVFKFLGNGAVTTQQEATDSFDQASVD